MAREFAKTNLEMWSDPDFRALPPTAQHLYLMLWTSPDLSYCGVHDWRPGRLAARSAGFTGEHIQTVADCLSARHFVVVDLKTEEILVRSWARWDGLLKQPRMAVSYSTAYAAVASDTLRAVLVHETTKMRKRHPGLACWKDDRVAGILEHPSISAKELPPVSDPFGGGFGGGFALGLPQTPSQVCPPVCTPPTTATATATYNSSTERADKPPTARKRASIQLPDDFTPNETNQRVAKEHGVNLGRLLPQFIDHHTAKGSTYKDWHAALNTWIRRERPTEATGQVRHFPNARDIQPAPDGLTDEQYAAWWAKQAGGQ